MLRGLFQPMHLLIILGIALVVVGPGKLPEIGKALGKSIQGFKKAIAGDDNDSAIEVKPQDTTDKQAQNITEIIGNHPYAGLFVLLILGGIGVPFFPEDATFILCGFLIQGKLVEPVPALLVIYIGVLIADLIIYLLGRKYCRMAVCHRWFQKILPPERLASLEDKFKKKGILFILFGRHFIGLRVQIFLVSGIMRMHPLKFLVTDAITVTFTIAVMVSIGYVGGHSLKDIGIDTGKIVYVVIFLFASFSIGYLLLKYIRGKRLGKQAVRAGDGEQHPAYIGKVKDFLSAGLSDSPRNIFLRLGIEIENVDFWESGLDEVERLLEETIRQAKKLGKLR